MRGGRRPGGQMNTVSAGKVESHIGFPHQQCAESKEGERRTSPDHCCLRSSLHMSQTPECSASYDLHFQQGDKVFRQGVGAQPRGCMVPCAISGAAPAQAQG